MIRAGKYGLLVAMGVSILLTSCERKDTERTETRALSPAAVQNAPDQPDSFSGVRAYDSCASLCALGPRPSGSAAYQKQVEIISRALGAVGWQVQTIPFSPATQPGRHMQNICATFGAGDSPRELILSCHIDTKGSGEHAILGADDGASGAAVLMELARVLSRRQELARRIELVFFDGEESFGAHITAEDGLYGSRYELRRRAGKLPRYLINLDMVGGAGKTIAVPFLDTTEEMLEQYLSAIHALGFSENRWTISPGGMLDDHRPFAEAGVHTLNLIASFGRSTWWHTKADNMERISADSLEETGRVVLQLLQQIISIDDLRLTIDDL